MSNYKRRVERLTERYTEVLKALPRKEFLLFTKAEIEWTEARQGPIPPAPPDVWQDKERDQKYDFLALVKRALIDDGLWSEKTDEASKEAPSLAEGL